MAKATTTVRVDRKTLTKKITLLPDYTSKEVFKVGVDVLVGINKTGKFIYGNVWKNKK